MREKSELLRKLENEMNSIPRGPRVERIEFDLGAPGHGQLNYEAEGPASVYRTGVGEPLVKFKNENEYELTRNFASLNKERQKIFINHFKGNKYIGSQKSIKDLIDDMNKIKYVSVQIRNVHYSCVSIAVTFFEDTRVLDINPIDKSYSISYGIEWLPAEAQHLLIDYLGNVEPECWLKNIDIRIDVSTK